jgi:UTP--glucose-1-phosphate uridylyltransferase
MDKPIRKAVLPVAGLGTRFLPATKAIPKEMLTVVDRPILQHVVDEAREAGIEHFIFVTGRNKAVIEDHFDAAYELEDTLTRRGKKAEYAALMADLPAAGATSFTRQQAPLGLGHAVWCAREIVGDEPFAVLLPDMVTRAGSQGGRCLAQCVAAYEKHGGNIIAVEEVPAAETHQYGIVGVGSDHGATFEITKMVEKPKQGTAPSNLIISRAGRKGRGRRNSTHGRHDRACSQAVFPRRALRRANLRLWLKARILKRQPRLRARPRRHCARAQGGTAPLGVHREGRLTSVHAD